MSKEHEVMLVVLHDMNRYGLFQDELNETIRLTNMNKRKGIDWKLFFRLAKLIRKEKPDVVHTHLRSIVHTFLSYIIPSRIKFIHTIYCDIAKEAGEGISKWCRKFAANTSGNNFE